LKQYDDLYDEHNHPLHKQSAGILLSDAEFYLEEHKMRGSQTGGFSALVSPIMKGNKNKIQPMELN
jgi:hypothetical protein